MLSDWIRRMLYEHTASVFACWSKMSNTRWKIAETLHSPRPLMSHKRVVTWFLQEVFKYKYPMHMLDMFGHVDIHPLSTSPSPPIILTFIWTPFKKIFSSLGKNVFANLLLNENNTFGYLPFETAKRATLGIIFGDVGNINLWRHILYIYSISITVYAPRRSLAWYLPLVLTPQGNSLNTSWLLLIKMDFLTLMKPYVMIRQKRNGKL